MEGELDLSGTQITTLPDNLVVGDELFLCCTPIITLPDYFICGSLYLDPEHFSGVAFRKHCGDNNRTIFAVRVNKILHISADCFYGPIEQFEDVVDRKYSGEAAEAYKQAARDCINELKEKLSARPQ
ncbi:hypothetical protein [Buttiauxella sp. 3AFRM03]|uniref:hypothetical protein n=1 Tax=Buttiauxella sp. 3AFRM03 TaxID=2479367 RepID=UPI001390331B|nr:hypothetical protein [Buttiauxella sp. 3AFRM03]